MKKLLLLLAVLFSFNFTSTAQGINDDCTDALRICAGFSFEMGKNNVFATSEGIMTCLAESRSVWFFVEGYKTGGSFTVSVEDTGALCGLNVEVFDGSCAGGSLGCFAVPANGTNSILITPTVSGTKYYIAVNTLAACPLVGESFTINVTTVNNGIIAAPEPAFSTDPVAPFAQCDTAMGFFTNHTIRHSDSIDYYWELAGGGRTPAIIPPASPDTLADSGRVDTFFFPPCVTYTVRLRACNRCHTDVPPPFDFCDQAQDVSAKVNAVNLEPELRRDSSTNVCVGNPLGIITSGNMNPSVIVASIYRITLKVYERCPNLDSTTYIMGDPTVPVGDPLPDTISLAPLVIIWDTVVQNPNGITIPTDDPGQDTVYHTTCDDTVVVFLDLDGNCASNDDPCPDTIRATYILDKPMQLVSPDTVYYCAEDLAMQLCVKVDTVAGTGVAPFTYEWYDSTVAPGQRIDSTTIPDTTNCTFRVNIDSLRDLLSFHPAEYENIPFRYIVRVEDSLGCFELDTMYLKLYKPVIDTIEITNLSDTTATCSPDTNASAICVDFVVGAYCPGDSIAFSYTVRGVPPLTLDWSPTTGIYDYEVAWVTDSLTDTAWVKSRTIETDFTLQLIVTDSMLCVDTFEICFPIHEPPTLVPPDSTCVSSLSDSIFLRVDGSCSGSAFDWDSTLARHNWLLESYSLPDSFIYFNWSKLGLPAAQLLDSIFEFSVEVTDGATGCIDTADLLFQFDSAVAICFTASDTGVCDGNSVTLSDGCDIVNVSYTWIAIAQLTPPDTFAIDTTPFITHTPVDTTTYIMVATRSGCVEVDTFVVDWYPNPNAEAADLDSTCVCETVALDGTGSDSVGVAYLWTSTGGNSIAEPDSLVTTAVACLSDVFTLRVTDTLTLCFKDTIISVLAKTPPISVPAASDSICFGGVLDTIILNGKGSTGNDLSYLWFSNPVVFIDSVTADSTWALASDTTTFCLIVTDTVLNCDDTVCDFLNLFIPFSLSATDSGFCAPDLPDTTTICVTGTSLSTSYDWSLTSAPFDTMITTPLTNRCISAAFDTVHTSGFYTFDVAVFDSLRGCPDTLTYPFRVDSGIVTLTVTRDTICGGQMDTITATGAAIYSWSSIPAAGINCLTPPFCDSIEVTPTVNTTFQAIGFAGQCRDTVPINVAVITPSANAGPDVDTCQSTFVNLNGTASGGSILWSDNGGNGAFSSTIIEDPTYTPHIDSAGVVLMLTITVTDTFGMCGFDVDTAYVTVDSLPLIDSISLTAPFPPDTVCECDTVALYSAVTASNTFAWSDGGAGGTFTPSNTILTPGYILCTGITTPQTVTLTLTASASGSACVPVMDSVTVVVMPLPLANAGASPSAICQGQSVTLAGSFTGNLVYWTHNGTGVLQDSTTATPTYYSTTSDAGTVVFSMIATTTLCGNDTSTVSLTINPRPGVTIASSDSAICAGGTITLRATGNVTYHFYARLSSGLDSLITTTTPPLDTISVDPSDTTLFILIGEDIATGCMDTAFITVNVLPNPVPVFEEPSYIVGKCYPLDVTVEYATVEPNVTSWQWDFGDGTLPAIDVVGPHLHTYARADSNYPVRYTIEFTVVHTYGGSSCTNSTQVSIEVCEDFSIPNAFTPNNDGKNDFFIIDGTDFANCRLVVFNRWGTKVYEANDYQNDWAGKDLNGKLLESDTYYYVYICDDERTWTGWIKLIR